MSTIEKPVILAYTCFRFAPIQSFYEWRFPEQVACNFYPCETLQYQLFSFYIRTFPPQRLGLKMISAEMKKLADAIRENGEAIRVFREQYIPALRSTNPTTNGQPRDAPAPSDTGAASSPADHAQLIQGIMDNMDTIQTLASVSKNRCALPVSCDCDINFDVRKCSILEDLNELPQTRFLSAVRSQSETVDSLVRVTGEVEKTLRRCS